MSGILYICPTPIGNLGDMTPRALDALRDADVVCAEDTRVTGKILAHFGIDKRLERLDEAAISTLTPRYIRRLLDGETVAFCSDAGMPGVSDPGGRLVDAAIDAGVTVEVLPGASAGVTAYVASGFACPRFDFGGFFPRRDAERFAVLRSLSSLDAVLLFYESPNRLADSLAVVAAEYPYRRVAVCRELTKIHQEVYRDTSGAVSLEFARRMDQEGVKGEIVMVIEPPTDQERQAVCEQASQDASLVAAQLLAEGSRSKKDVAKELQRQFGLSRNQAYDLVYQAQQS